MVYTISQAADLAGISAHTLRYYDKLGLLPFVDRDKNGNRAFKKSDIEWLGIITCLKKSGMSIKKIRQYVEWGMKGDTTLKERLEVFETHKLAVLNQIEEMQSYLQKIDYKIWYYKTAISHGTTAALPQDNCIFVEDLN
ncbi:MerR family transcriptional regulator [Paenibacillus sp. NPDC058071]|uniref:MerR family transcriptional regulator n=1 Tax=Paenibacillus sp. NPDC058071 TaxID=3346326 RepID=UPI0036DA1F4D